MEYFSTQNIKDMSNLKKQFGYKSKSFTGAQQNNNCSYSFGLVEFYLRGNEGRLCAVSFFIVCFDLKI